jgi:hypothetical protein
MGQFGRSRFERRASNAPDVANINIIAIDGSGVGVHSTAYASMPFQIVPKMLPAGSM